VLKVMRLAHNMADHVREKPFEALPLFLPATQGIKKALA
jgi:hypothetical protein